MQKGGTRLWRLTFDTIKNVEAGGKIDLLLDAANIVSSVGVDKPNMLDNISVNTDNTITLLEDTGGAEHNGKLWQFNPQDKSLKLLAKFDPALFGDIVAGKFIEGTHTQDEESSGVIDITQILNRQDHKKYQLLVAQDHALAAHLKSIGAMNAEADATAMFQGGQLILMSAPMVHSDGDEQIEIKGKRDNK